MTEITFQDANYPTTPRDPKWSDWEFGHQQQTYQHRIDEALAHPGPTADANKAMAELFKNYGEQKVYHVEYGRVP